MVECARNLDPEVPLVAKISFNWEDVLGVVRECVRLGVQGIEAMDSVGPALRIDVNTGRALLGGEKGLGWLSGAAIFPLSLALVARVYEEMTRRHKENEVLIIGTGGVSSAENVIEMIMAGASAVGICTLPLRRGLKIFQELRAKTEQYLRSKKINNIVDIRGSYLKSTRGYGRTHEVKAYLDRDRCNLCEICVKLCPYRARDIVEEAMVLHESSCRICGFCGWVCPKGAIYFQ